MTNNEQNINRNEGQGRQGKKMLTTKLVNAQNMFSTEHFATIMAFSQDLRRARARQRARSR